MQTQRIVFVNHTGQISGAESMLLHLLKGLDRAHYDPVVVCPASGNLRAAVEADGVQWVAMPALLARFTLRPDRLFRYLLSMAGVMAALRRTIRGLAPSFVHANTIRAGIAVTVATAGTGIPVLWHAHDILPRHPLSSIIRRVAFRSSRTQIIAVSHATARAFSGRLPFGSRIRVVYNGTELNRFPLKEPGDAPLKKEWSLASDSFLACTVGQICPRKGLRELIEAFTRCCDAVPRMHLAIVGKPLFAHDEQYREDVVRQVAAANIGDRVHFAGQRSDISSVLQSADLFVLNSREEPFGLVLIEAMASGTPVLATRVGGIPEIVTDSVNGFLVESGDTAGLAAKLMELSQCPELLAEVATTAREHTCPRFSVAQFQAGILAVYQDIGRRSKKRQPAQPDRALEIQ